MKRIIFVDDEQPVLDGLRNLLHKCRSEMELVFASSGAAALAELETSPTDVIVSDMRMPGMDGAELLARVKEDYPATIRVILSGHSDKEAVFRSLHVAHQILSKPCDADQLRNALKRACYFRSLLEDDGIRKILGSLDNLPSLPGAYWNLVNALSDPELSLRKITEIVETDSAMCMKLLQLVNSPCFGIASEITSIERAVSYLGVDLIRSLALSVNVFRAMDRPVPIPGFSLEAMQEHELLTAKVAAVLFPEYAAEAFSAALLHDIGYIALACCDAEPCSAAVEDFDAAERRDWRDAESELPGLNHATAGAYLLGIWGLPASLIDAVAYHHDPSAAGSQSFDLPSAVAVADTLVDQEMAGGHETSFPDALTVHLEALGVRNELPRWRERACRELDVLMARN